MSHKLPTTPEEHVAWVLANSDAKGNQRLDINYKSAYDWLSTTGVTPEFIPHLYFVLETDMGIGFQTHVATLSGIVIFSSTDINDNFNFYSLELILTSCPDIRHNRYMV